MPSRPGHFYEFGPFTLDASERVLRRGDEFVRLTPKESELLLALVRGAGRVLPKEELLREVWADTFVEEATLAQNVFTLRKALGRADASQQYIETVPRRGYRFVPKVTERVEKEEEPAAFVAGAAVAPAGGAEAHGAGAQAAREEAAAAPAEETAGNVSRGGAPEGHPARAAVLIALAAVVCFGGLIYAVYRLALRRHLEPPRTAPFEAMQLTRLPVPGAVFEAAVSPDGNVLAYVTNEAGGGQSVWVKQISAPSDPRRLVPPAAGTIYPVLNFAPDGQHVYYLAARQDGPSASLQRVPVFGGSARRVLEDVNSPVSFSPDGRRFAFVRGLDRQRTLYVADADGANARPLSASVDGRILNMPAWSPDGRTVACAYLVPEEYDSGRAATGVTTFDAASGAEGPELAGRWFELNRMLWLPDGGGLLLSASERELSPAQVWRVPFPEGEPRRVTNDLNSYQGLSLTADARGLVTVQTDRVPNIWVAPVSDPSRARQLTTGAGRFDGYYGVAWTPDGRILYSSVASGGWDIWVMNADGTGARQLTRDARSNYGPAVSPDGRHVVFVSNRAGGPFNIWRMDADGANPKRLTDGRGENFPHVTPDGRWVVYSTSAAADRPRIWKVPIDGGEPVAISPASCSWPFVAPDGQSFVCVYSPAPGGPLRLAVIPIDGGEPTKLFDVGPTFRMNTVWAPDNRGITYLDAGDGTPNIWLQPLAGGRPVPVTSFTPDGVTAFDFSRDGKQLVLTRTTETTGVVLIRNFK